MLIRKINIKILFIIFIYVLCMFIHFNFLFMNLSNVYCHFFLLLIEEAFFLHAIYLLYALICVWNDIKYKKKKYLLNRHFNYSSLSWETTSYYIHIRLVWERRYIKGEIQKKLSTILYILLLFFFALIVTFIFFFGAWVMMAKKRAWKACLK